MALNLTNIAFLVMLSLWLTACGDLEEGVPQEEGGGRFIDVQAPTVGEDKDIDRTAEDPVDEDAPVDGAPDGEGPVGGGTGEEPPANEPSDNDGSDNESPDPDTETPGDGSIDGDEPGDTPGDGVVTPPPAEPPTQITDNVFFPYADDVAWHYDNSDVVTLGAPRDFAGKTISPLRHSLDIQVFGDEYFYVGDGTIYYGGINANTDSIPSMDTAEARIEFVSLRKVYDQYSDSGSIDYLKRGTIATEPEWQRVGLVYNWRSEVLRKELIETVQYGPVPAVAVDISVSVQIPFKLKLTSGIWFAPGLGIVARELAGLTTRLDYVEGLAPPVVFSFDQGQGLSQPKQQLLLDGMPITDHTWQTQVAYMAGDEDWLSVDFDSSGSWRASLQGQELEAGLHVAQIHFTRASELHKLVVSVLVQ